MALFLEQTISKYVASIPTPPQNVSVAIVLTKDNRLAEAARLIDSNAGLKAYILQKAASPVFSFADIPKNVSHAMSLFGVPVSVALLEGYLLAMLTPKKWKIFNLTNAKYYDFQSDLIASWQRILDIVCPSKAKKYISAATLLGASIAICEAILADNMEDVELLQTQGLTLNDILKRTGGFSLYDIASKIGTKLDFDELATRLVMLAQNPSDETQDAEILKLARLLHILFFYKLSRPFAIEALMNELALYETDAAEPELTYFLEIIGEDFEN